MGRNWAIGVDIGGTHVACAAADIATGAVLEPSFCRKSFDNQDEAERILGAWAEAIGFSMSKIPFGECAGIGFAMPGPFDYREGISNMAHKFPKLRGIHLPAALRPLLPQGEEMKMRFINDASAFAVGEAWAGEGRDAHRAVCITLGTGFGSAFVEAGVPVVNRPDVPPEGCLWHLPYREGIADDYFSTRWLVGAYQKISGETLPGVKELAGKAGEKPEVAQLFEQFGRNLAECLLPWLHRFRADVLVVGGNISHALHLFKPALLRDFKEHGCETKVTPSQLKEAAALIGSARLLDDMFWEKVYRELPKF